jgi:hypothetical protein
MSDTHTAGLSKGDPVHHELAAWMLAIIEWLRVRIVIQRHIWSDDLARLPQVGRYLDQSDTRPPDVCVDL